MCNSNKIAKTDTLRNEWKIWIKVFSAVTLMLSLVLSFVQLVIDPFDVWKSPSIAGLNNVRVGKKTERLRKLYEYALYKPSVLFIGNSRTKYGIPPYWPNTPEEDVYNFGLDSMAGIEILRTCESLVKIHRPNIIVLMIDTLTFYQTELEVPEQFSQERLNAYAFSRMTGLLYKLQETVFTIDALNKSKETVRKSRKLPHVLEKNDRGYLSKYGNSKRLNVDKVRKIVWRCIFTSKARHGSKPFVDAIIESVRKLKQENIEIFLVWNPEYAISQLLIDETAKSKTFEKIKRRLVEVTPLWDFRTINSVTQNTNNYIDGSHFSGDVGRMIIKRLNGQNDNVPSDFGKLVKSNNIDKYLTDVQKRLNLYRQKNADFLHEVKSVRKHRNKDQFFAKADSLLGISTKKKRK